MLDFVAGVSMNCPGVMRIKYGRFFSNRPSTCPPFVITGPHRTIKACGEYGDRGGDLLKDQDVVFGFYPNIHLCRYFSFSKVETERMNKVLAEKLTFHILPTKRLSRT